MEISNEDTSSPKESSTSPTASTEKWIEHAKKKLSQGYVLIVNMTRRNANFFMPGKGYEMCSYQAAHHLVKHGVVIEAGTHYLGTLYTLQTNSTSVQV